jgi:hypothetical protein
MTQSMLHFIQRAGSCPVLEDCGGKKTKVTENYSESGCCGNHFIVEKIENGDEQLFPALIELTKSKGNKVVADASISNKKEWVVKTEEHLTFLLSVA